MRIGLIARLAHEVNRAYCEAIGDHSQLPWDDAPGWQRDSAFAGVMFALNNNLPPPKKQHEEWMRHKIEDGWTYGKKKDAAAKTHPCIVPWDQLPPEQKIKDMLFRAVVEAAKDDAVRG